MIFLFLYEPHRHALEAFRLAYGPGGAWDNFFQSQPGYVGLELFELRSHLYLIAEEWEGAGDRERAKGTAMYKEMCRTFEQLFETEIEYAPGPSQGDEARR
jgi:hypothetical protein